MTLYRDIVKQAIITTWQRKYLWFFGLFAVLLGSGGELEVVFRGLDRGADDGLFAVFTGLYSTGILSGSAAQNIVMLAQREPLSLFVAITVLLAILALSVFLVWLSHVSLGALVHAAAAGRQGKAVAFRPALDAGVGKFWPVFGLNAALKALLWLAFLVMGLSLVSERSAAYADIGGWLFVATFLVFVPVGIVLSFIVKYAIAFVVVRDRGFGEAVKLGWELFVRNWLVSIEMAFLLFFLTILAGIALLFGLLLVSVPFLLLALILYKLTFFFNFWLLIVAMSAVFIAAIVTAGAMLSTFQVHAWTNLFLELVSRGGVSKLVRIFGRE